MKKISYDIEIEARGLKRDIYIVLANRERERRHAITLVTINHLQKRFVLRHVKKEKLGALIDVVGIVYFHSLLSVMYHKMLSFNQNIRDGKYLFTAILVPLKEPTAVSPPRFDRVLNGYLLDPKLIPRN